MTEEQEVQTELTPEYVADLVERAVRERLEAREAEAEEEGEDLGDGFSRVAQDLPPTSYGVGYRRNADTDTEMVVLQIPILVAQGIQVACINLMGDEDAPEDLRELLSTVAQAIQHCLPKNVQWEAALTIAEAMGVDTTEYDHSEPNLADVAKLAEEVEHLRVPKAKLADDYRPGNYL